MFNEFASNAERLVRADTRYVPTILAEYRIHNAGVVGSSPTVATILDLVWDRR